MEIYVIIKNITEIKKQEKELLSIQNKASRI